MMALPMDDPSCAREKVRLAVQNKEVDIKSDDGVKKLLEELDKTFKKDDVSKLCEVWTEYINFKREKHSMEEYITQYEKKVAELKRQKINIPTVVLAMQLLNGSEINQHDKQIVLTAVDYTNEQEMLNQMKNNPNILA